MNSKPLLDVQNLVTEFGSIKDPLRVVNGISFSIYEGETIGLVGESGSGKSVTCLSAMNLLPTARVSGSVRWKSESVLDAPRHRHQSWMGKEMAMIFQSPQASFNPVFTIGYQFIETIQAHHRVSKPLAKQMAIELLKQVNIPDPELRMSDYPHQFSLGMCQRMMIALTLSMSPSLLIADEPTASLDVTIQAQVMALIEDIKQTHPLSVLLISHDLGLVAQYCDRVMVMYLGDIVESGPTVDVFQNPQHPYTISLLQSIPSTNPHHRVRPVPIMGDIPSPKHRPSGCPFNPRCPLKTSRCVSERPSITTGQHRHHVACFESALYQG